MTRLRWIQALLLVRPAARTIRWIPVPACGALGFFVVYAGLHEKGQIGNAHLPYAAIAICLSAAFVLDDAAAETVGGTPTPLLLRHGVRIAIELPALFALWGAILAYAGFEELNGAMWVEFAGMLTLTLALAAIGSRFVGGERAGMFAGPALLIVLVASAFVPARWRPFPVDPISSGWFDLYGRWTIALFASLVVFVTAGRGPARVNPFRRMAFGVLRHRVVTTTTAPQAVR
ncbi:MAG: hypothetical protein M3P43_17495 [Actinomycetota bacterium]|nr:hypothetical protein [Actinomycetota bacterium]